ncbi:flagellin [Aminobacter sp. AP02]|uniref:flagellin N-terminal helical domain-containing protein n=1 Tax=Aminobacter sp. AP02 TaxID=2135737 RepID=UPI000D6BDA08|nr:flagellin [Aminobacter sp. AP02]PWK71648.1 flagellin [Aminobacter sp. AP02]
MSSIMTNASAMTALQSLSATNKALQTTQGRISTGFRVAEASDNAAYWSIATTMRSDNNVNSVVQDALGLGSGKVDTAYTAINNALTAVDKIKKNVLLAKNVGPEQRAKLQTEIDTYVAQLKDAIGGANYAGSNLLQTDSSKDTANPTATPPVAESNHFSIISSYNRDSTGVVSTGSIDIALKNVRLIDDVTPAAGPPVVAKSGILDKKGHASDVSLLNIKVDDLTGVKARDAADAVIATPTESQAFDALLTDVETVLASMADAASELGAAKARIDMQKDFVSKLMDSIDRGVGQLVDADMNKESTRLQALQVQQQLGIQALSIANSNSQNILSLFKG